MLHFKPTERASKGRQPWPELLGNEQQTVFTERPSLRRMVVVVDHILLAEADEAALTPRRILGGLLTDPYIKLLRYSDAGPGPDVPRETHEHFGDTVPGWIVVGEALPDDPFHYPVVHADGTTVTHTAVLGNAVQLAGTESRTPSDGTLSPDAERTRRRSDALAAQAAASVGADLFITSRPYLHAVPWDIAPGVLIARPEEALPLVSLYLRAQGKYITYRTLDGHGTSTMNRGLFYWVGVRELLPAGWRWFSACVRPEGDHRLTYLAQSLFQRVQRALLARDAAHRALNRPPNNDTAQETLDSLDQVMLALMGAIDVAARVAHRVLELDVPEHQASWRRKDWLKAVRTEAPNLADHVAPRSDAGRTLVILALLRNTIHGEALDALTVSSSLRRIDEFLAGLPHDDGARLVEAMHSHGGRASWGVRELLEGRYHADPGLLLERTVREVITLLDDLMRLTPVERLDPHAEIEPREPPNDNTFSELNRLSIRWQLGF